MTASPVINWRALRAQAAQPLPQGRLPLRLNGATIGSVLQDDVALFAACHPALQCTPNECLISGDTATANAALAAMARALKYAGKLKAWRDELLPVMPLPREGEPLLFAPEVASLERAAARRLGVLTHAVHLIGFAENGAMWLQERALSKSTDPGLWDTLAGGLVATGDTLHSGMMRETHEEAGLTPAQLLNVQAHGVMLVQQAVPEGVMLELAWMYSATLATDASPRNLDGEVASFACLSKNDVRAKIVAGQVTLEAALAIGVVWGELDA